MSAAAPIAVAIPSRTNCSADRRDPICLEQPKRESPSRQAALPRRVESILRWDHSPFLRQTHAARLPTASPQDAANPFASVRRRFFDWRDDGTAPTPVSVREARTVAPYPLDYTKL